LSKWNSMFWLTLTHKIKVIPTNPIEKPCERQLLMKCQKWHVWVKRRLYLDIKDSFIGKHICIYRLNLTLINFTFIWAISCFISIPKLYGDEINLHVIYSPLSIFFQHVVSTVGRKNNIDVMVKSLMYFVLLQLFVIEEITIFLVT
jgi:hypothetical protein